MCAAHPSIRQPAEQQDHEAGVPIRGAVGISADPKGEYPLQPPTMESKATSSPRIHHFTMERRGNSGMTLSLKGGWETLANSSNESERDYHGFLSICGIRFVCVKRKTFIFIF